MSAVLAHHALWVALPFAGPAIVVSAGIGVMAFLQRGQEEDEEQDPALV